MPQGALGCLVRHFFDRFFDTESLSPGADPETNVVQILGFLAVPSGFFILLCQPMLLVRWELISVRNFFVSFSMIAMGFIMVFEWDGPVPRQARLPDSDPAPHTSVDPFRGEDPGPGPVPRHLPAGH